MLRFLVPLGPWAFRSMAYRPVDPLQTVHTVSTVEAVDAVSTLKVVNIGHSVDTDGAVNVVDSLSTQ